MAIEPTTAERLVRLRNFLQAAQAATADTTASGRHAAVVALDGVCELAMGLAAHERGVAITEKGGLPALLGRLQSSLGKSWQHKGVKGFTELHRARNAAQHHGVLPDAEHVPLWTAEVERFVRSLVAAVFDVELVSVSVATSVETDALRHMLLEAEQKLEGGDYADSLRLSWRALQDGLRRFRQKRGRGIQTSPMPSLGDLPELKDLRQGFAEAQTFLDIATLAPDPGEWIWLRAAVQHLGRTRRPPDKQDAQRGLAFVLGWILRYESFAARYASAEVHYEQPATADPYEQYERPRVTGIELVDLPRKDRTRLSVSLSEMPPQWDYWIDVRDPGVSAFANSDPGASEFFVEILNHLQADDVWRIVTSIVDETHQRFEETMKGRRDQEAAGAALVNDYLQELSSHDPERRVRKVSFQLRGGDYVLAADLDWPTGVNRFATQEAINARLGDRGNVYLDETGLYFSPSVLPASDLLSLVDQGIADAGDRENEDEAVEAEQRRRRTDLVDDLQLRIARGV